jgi:hypothetical protein
MRALILALAIAGLAGAAAAQQDDTTPNGLVRFNLPPPAAPVGARKEAEAAIIGALPSSAAAKFRYEGVKVASSVQHGAEAAVSGPVSVVCGQYSTRDDAGAYGGYAWFYVAIKHGEVLWFDLDDAASGHGVAYGGCQGAGMAN